MSKQMGHLWGGQAGHMSREGWEGSGGLRRRGTKCSERRNAVRGERWQPCKQSLTAARRPSQGSLVFGRHQAVVSRGDGAGARQAPPPHARALPKQRVVHGEVARAQGAAFVARKAGVVACQ